MALPKHFIYCLFTCQDLNYHSHCPKKWYKVKVKSLSCVRLCDPMDCSLPCPSAQEIFQAVSLPSPEDFSDPGIEPVSPAL